MKKDYMTEKGFCLIAKGHKPLCSTEQGFLTYHKHALYLYQNGSFHKLFSFSAGWKEKLMGCNRILERMTRSAPQSAVSVGDDIYVARRHTVLQISLADKKIKATHSYRKSYIHTNKLSLIQNVSGFEDCVAYGEYFPNAKRESVHVHVKSLAGGGEWKDVFAFEDGAVRHIHALVPDAEHGCVYILTGDEDRESGIWRATDNFSCVEPLLVGDQAYRSCIAYAEGNSIVYSTDIPSRQNRIARYDLGGGNPVTVLEIPGSSTLGCDAGGVKIFCTSVETEEPKTRGKKDRIKYLLSRKLAKGILDAYPRVYVENTDGTYIEWLKFEKDFWPAGLFRFGRALPVYDERTDTLYLCPGAVKKYDGKLYAIPMSAVNPTK